MPVEQIQAWRTSDGQCYADKARAYHAEMVILLQGLPSVGRKGFALSVFTESIAAYQALSVKLAALRANLDYTQADGDRKILAGLSKLTDSTAAWLKQAESLRQQMAGENDVEVAKRVAGQE